MRRGQRNKWTFDREPHNGSIVVHDNGKRLEFFSVESFHEWKMHREHGKAALNKLRKYGWLK